MTTFTEIAEAARREGYAAGIEAAAKEAEESWRLQAYEYQSEMKRHGVVIASYIRALAPERNK